MNSNVLEDDPEWPLHVSVGLGNRVSMLSANLAVGHLDVVNGAKLRFLLCRSRINKILAVQLIALFVDVGETVEKVFSFFLGGPFRQNQIDELVYARAFGSRSVRRRNNQINHGDDGGVLMRVQRSQG